jgi:hypothetical protein
MEAEFEAAVEDRRPFQFALGCLFVAVFGRRSAFRYRKLRRRTESLFDLVSKQRNPDIAYHVASARYGAPLSRVDARRGGLAAHREVRHADWSSNDHVVAVHGRIDARSVVIGGANRGAGDRICSGCSHFAVAHSDFIRRLIRTARPVACRCFSTIRANDRNFAESLDS